MCGHRKILEALTFTSLSTEAINLLQGVVPLDWHGDDQLLRGFLLSWYCTYSSCPWLKAKNQQALHHQVAISVTIGLSFRARNLYHVFTFSQSHLEKRILNPPMWTATNFWIIHLFFEVDCNFILKLLRGSRLVRQADAFNLLRDMQYGSVPRRTTIDPIMMIQLTTDLCHILKRNMVGFDNNASACYNRKVVALSLLAARIWRMTASAIRTHATAIELMQYTAKAIYEV